MLWSSIDVSLTTNDAKRLYVDGGLIFSNQFRRNRCGLRVQHGRDGL